MTCLGIIGGSGLEHFPELEGSVSLSVATDWGTPSSPLQKGQLGGVEAVFLSRHGETHSIAPHLIDYRANIAALAEQGVEAIVAVNVVGGIDPEMCPGDLVVPRQIIDYTYGREHSFFDGREQPLQHIDFTYPYSESVRERIVSNAIGLGLNLHSHGVYGVTQGPRLETAAEIERMARDGCDIVGMTSMPEAALARELDIPYACLALVVNPAAGLSETEISMDAIDQMITEKMAEVRRLLVAIARSFDQ